MLKALNQGSPEFKSWFHQFLLWDLDQVQFKVVTYNVGMKMVPSPEVEKVKQDHGKHSEHMVRHTLVRVLGGGMIKKSPRLSTLLLSVCSNEGGENEETDKRAQNILAGCKC